MPVMKDFDTLCAKLIQYFISLHLLVTKECTRPDLAVSVDEGVQELVERDGMSHGFYKEYVNTKLLFTTCRRVSG